MVVGHLDRHQALMGINRDMARLRSCGIQRLAAVSVLDHFERVRARLVKRQLTEVESLRPAVRQAAYRLGSLETFMRMVESGNGITFIPELATLQLSKEQKELVRPFAIPKPTREIVFVTRKDFIRHTVAGILIESIKKAVPKEMLTLQPGQKVV